MLTVVLQILKIIGLILLVLLGLILFVLLLVLFMPIVYRVQAKQEPSFEKPQISVKVRWLFGLLRGRFLYPDPGNIVVKVLFFTVYDSAREHAEDTTDTAGAEDTVGMETTTDTADAADAEATAMTEVSPEAGPTPAGSAQATESPAADQPSSAENSTPAADTADSAEAAQSLDDKIETKIEKIKYTFHSTCDKIKDVRENVSHYKEIWDDPDTQAFLRHALKRVGRILKGLRPRKLQADVRFGTGSPDTTGYVFAVYGMLSPYLGRHCLLTPDFDEAVVEGEALIAGHVMICQILWQALLLILDRKFWKLLSAAKGTEEKPDKHRR
ncbi:MAG: DUF2953 domain-containing protein [Lachnospiraceae bacterium]|nr:DUF2953 domain-containing protein [Lachnospiraceae bacterium]